MAGVLSASLNPVLIKQQVASWLQEDCPAFDYAGFVVGTNEEVAVLLAKSKGILAGCQFFDAIFEELNCKVAWADGVHDSVSVGSFSGHTHLAKVRGRVCDILRGERVALNCLSRASGVASTAGEAVRIANSCNWPGKIAGTRKTTPGFRMVEKYALSVVGADTHRYDLSSMTMLKDNHLWAVGSIPIAVTKCKEIAGFTQKIEVECRSLTEAREAARAGCDIVMLDNFTPDAAKAAAAALKKDFPGIWVEVSGEINMETLASYLGPDVDVVSMGELTQGYATVDFSLKIHREDDSARKKKATEMHVPF